MAPRASKKASAPAPVKDEQVAPPKSKRKILSPAERVAKLEADLAAAREKAAEKDTKSIDRLLAERSKHGVKAAELVAKVADINEQLQLLGYEEPDDSDGSES